MSLRKVDLITWDHEHQQKWYHLISPEGTWLRGNAMAGRKIRRQELLDHWRSPRSVDRYPEGTANYGFLGSPVNVVHSEEDFRRNGIAFATHVENMREIQGPYYPGTSIPMSATNIGVNLWRQDGKNAIGVVFTFLHGGYATHESFVRQRDRTEKMIESAFFELGYRINRATMAEANEEMRQGAVSAFRCQAWRDNPPLKVDRYKGGDLKKAMKRMLHRADHGTDDEDSDNEDEDDNGGNDGGGDDVHGDFDGSSGAHGGSGPRCGSGGGNDNSQNSKRRRHQHRSRRQDDSDSSSEDDSQPKRKRRKETSCLPKDEPSEEESKPVVTNTMTDPGAKSRRSIFGTPLLRKLAADAAEKRVIVNVISTQHYMANMIDRHAKRARI